MDFLMLNPVEMTKLSSRKFHINSKKAIEISAKLYRDDLIWYSCADTQKCKSSKLPGLKKVIEELKESPINGNIIWGYWALISKRNNEYKKYRIK